MSTLPIRTASNPVTALLGEHPELQAIDLLIADLNGVLRGKRVERDALAKVYASGVCLPASVFAMDITGSTVESTGLGFAQGDADRVCRPVPGSLAPVPWHAGTGQLLLSMFDGDDSPFFADPRNVLVGVQARFGELELTPVVAVEIEFYLIDAMRDPQGRPQAPRSPVTGERERSTQVYGMRELDDYRDFLSDVAAAAREQNLPADAAVAEYAPGQYEINLRHVRDAALACDQAILLKRLIRGVAQRHGMDATFMAKPYPEQAGSGMHVHVSLSAPDGRNAFADAGGERLLRAALGGLMRGMPGSMGIFAPNANSFRRFRRDSYVPLRPCWGENNRTTALRIPAGPPGDRRIEHRVAGADANPYLLVATLLADIHHGIVEGLEPGPAETGNAYEREGPGFPTGWWRALAALESNEPLADYLGRDFMRVYLACKRAELERFAAHITPLEHDWYLRTV